MPVWASRRRTPAATPALTRRSETVRCRRSVGCACPRKALRRSRGSSTTRTSASYFSPNNAMAPLARSRVSRSCSEVWRRLVGSRISVVHQVLDREPAAPRRSSACDARNRTATGRARPAIPSGSRGRPARCAVRRAAGGCRCGCAACDRAASASTLADCTGRHFGHLGSSRWLGPCAGARPLTLSGVVPRRNHLRSPLAGAGIPASPTWPPLSA